MEDYLKQKVPELFLQSCRVAGRFCLVDRVERLVSFFKQVLGERSIRLFAVPGATARSAEPGHDGDKLVERFGHEASLAEVCRVERVGRVYRCTSARQQTHQTP